MPVLDNVSASVARSLASSDLAGAKVRAASALFSLYGFDALRRELESADGLEFLFTVPAFSEVEEDEAPDSFHEVRDVAGRVALAAITGTQFETHLKNSLTQQVIARECVAWISSHEVKFKAYQGSPQVTPLLAVGAEQVFSPIAGFTADGLGAVENPSPYITAVHGPDETKQFLKYFDAIWSSPALARDVTAQVVDSLEKLYAVNSPAFVYFVMLYNVFAEFLDTLQEDYLPNDLTGFKETHIWQSLFSFQKDAATGIINRLERFNGCILADSVGLGKTYTALAVMKYYELRNKRVLVLAPKKLMGNWSLFNNNLVTNPLVEDRFAFDVLAHTDIGRETGKSGEIDLAILNWGNYDLVVIDESHNFRNVGTSAVRESRYQKLMRKVVSDGVQTKLLMLSATPVNNRFSDLKNQLELAYEGNSGQLAEHLGIDSTLDGVFRQAQRVFAQWSDLDEESRTPTTILKMLNFDFFEVLDAVTIARSRKQIQRNYDTSDVGVFPVRNAPKSLRKPLTYLPGAPSFTDVNHELMKLNLAVYTPLAFVHASALSNYEDADTQNRATRTAANVNAQGREAGLQKLMAVNLLKRLESSVEAFRLTLTGLQTRLCNTLNIVESYQGAVSNSVAFSEADLAQEDLDTDDELIAATVGGKVKIQLADMDTRSWESALRQDLEVISGLLDRIAPITVDYDAKLQQLFAHIVEKAENPLNEGNRKVLVFTAFADTAEYLYRELHPRLQQTGLESALVTGSAATKTTVEGVSGFDQVLTLFSPVSKNREKAMSGVATDIDVVFATDCISEGQNLQDCDWLVNYDIHWNPVRIIQRFGRVDRIGSQNSRIQLVNFWPDVELDEYLNIKDRVENRMVIANMAGTGDDNVLLTAEQGAESDADYRKRQLQRLQEEVLDLEDADTGISITDLGLNDYRSDLQNLLQIFGKLSEVSSGVHAAVPADGEKGLVPGALFLVKDSGSGQGNRGNRLHPHLLVYVDEAGKPVTDFLDPKQVLSLLRLACFNRLEPVDEAVQIFDRLTDQGRSMGMYRQLLESALRSVDTAAGDSLVDDLFSGTLSSLSGQLSGSDRFEVLAFLAVVTCL